MVPFETFFYGLILLFGIIGAMRGWAKELLVIFSAILSRFVEVVLFDIVPFIGPALTGLPPKTKFYVRILISGVVVIFGYATPAVLTRFQAKARKEKFQDLLLGFFIGAINGFLIIGMLWGFMETMGYGIWGISAPATAAAQTIAAKYLPTVWLAGPLLYAAVALAFAFVLIVFI